MRIIGLLICLAIVAGAIFHVGLDLYNDALSAQFVLGGATGYTVLKGNYRCWSRNFGKGAVFFGWLGTLIGLIAVMGGTPDIKGTFDDIRLAMSVALLPVFYGYLAKLICITIEPADNFS